MTRLIRRYRSLFFRFPLILGLVVILLLLINTLLYNSFFSGHLRRDFHRDVAMIADTMVPVIIPVVVSGKTALLNIPLSKDNLLNSLVIKSSSGEILYAVKSSRTPVNILSVHRTLRSGGRIIGSAVFHFRKNFFERKIRGGRIFLIVFSLVLFAVILVTIHFLLLKQIRRPLQLMMRATELIARGEFSPRMRFPVRDELALLGADIKAMGHRLKRSFREIEEKNEAIRQYSEGLEEMVASRTEELDGANKALENRNREYVRELEMARSVQLGMIPVPDTVIGHELLEVAVHYNSMSRVGGDLLDVVRTGRNSYAFLIADVSGHGVPSSLITVMAKVSFMTNCHWGLEPGEICRQVNREIYRLIRGQRYFISMYIGVMDMETGVFSYCNGGHHPAVFQKQQGELQLLDSDGRLVGVWEDSEFESRSVVLSPGDAVLLYTDGITESRNPEGEMFGKERLYRYCRDFRERECAVFLQGIVRDVDIFTNGRDAEDDRALLYFRFHGLENHTDSI